MISVYFSMLRHCSNERKTGNLMIETVIDFLRHGEPEGGRLFRGHGIDDPLSEKGWQQMWTTVGKECPWTQVVSSPLQRCQAFAAALAERHGLPLAVDERLKEVGFGAWEGRSPQEVEEQDPAEYAAFYADPVHNRPAGAEPLEAFFARVAAGFSELERRYQGQQVLVVAHAGVIRAALAHVLQTTPEAAYAAQVPNAGLTRFRCGDGRCSLVFHGRLSLPS
jgi:alpha-ribazole phosphatase